MAATLGWRQKQLYTHRCRLYKPAAGLDAASVGQYDTWTMAEDAVKCYFRRTPNMDHPEIAGRLRVDNLFVTDTLHFGLDQVIGEDWLVQNLTLDASGAQANGYLDYWQVRGQPRAISNQGMRQAGHVEVLASQEQKAPPGVDLRENLRAYWTFESLTFPDVTGLGHTLTASGSPALGTGHIGQAVQLNGTTQYLSQAAADLQVGTEDFSVALWVNLDATSGLRTFVSAWDATNSHAGWSLGYSGISSHFSFDVSPTGLAADQHAIDAVSFGPATVGNWYLVIAWHSAALQQIGIAVGDVNGTLSLDTTAHTTGVYKSPAALTIGRNTDGGNPTAGRIDSAGFWKIAPSLCQRTQLLNGGLGRDYPFS